MSSVPAPEANPQRPSVPTQVSRDSDPKLGEQLKDGDLPGDPSAEERKDGRSRSNSGASQSSVASDGSLVDPDKQLEEGNLSGDSPDFDSESKDGKKPRRKSDDLEETDPISSHAISSPQLRVPISVLRSISQASSGGFEGQGLPYLQEREYDNPLNDLGDEDELESQTHDRKSLRPTDAEEHSLKQELEEFSEDLDESEHVVDGLEPKSEENDGLPGSTPTRLHALKSRFPFDARSDSNEIVAQVQKSEESEPKTKTLGLGSNRE